MHVELEPTYIRMWVSTVLQMLTSSLFMCAYKRIDIVLVRRLSRWFLDSFNAQAYHLFLGDALS